MLSISGLGDLPLPADTRSQSFSPGDHLKTRRKGKIVEKRDTARKVRSGAHNSSRGRTLLKNFG
jgi:hypothetical protein